MRRAAFVLAIALVACTRRDPPMWDAAGASPSIAPLSTSAADADVSAGVQGNAYANAQASEVPVPATPAASVDPATLPQTRDRPSPSGAAFDARVAALWSAIITGDPSKAMPFFFPLAAYEQVKDIPSPQNDWKKRLVAAYERDIKALHAKLGDRAARAQWVGIEVPMDRARWVKPGEEVNRIGYFRVFGSKLKFTANGAEDAFEVKSMISWRGEWYVVHLSRVK
jgi:hypothetical protein